MIAVFFAALAFLASYIAYVGGLPNVARHRKYKSGTGWCVWRWTDVDSEYILRLHVLKTPWFAVCLHWIRKADAEPWLHDHPVSFLSLVLRGQYAEMRQRDGGPVRMQLNRWFNYIRASDRDRHRIVLTRTNTLTLCFMGPKTREWGFHVWTELEPSGWIGWKDYYARMHKGEDMRQLAVGYGLISLAADYAEIKRAERERALVEGAYHDEERELDTAPPAEFNADEVTWPGDHTV